MDLNIVRLGLRESINEVKTLVYVTDETFISRLHTVWGYLFHEFGHDLSSGFIVKRVADGHIVQDFLESECHTSTNNHFIDLVQHVFNQLDLVSNLEVQRMQWVLYLFSIFSYLFSAK